jgi:multidrug efflux pump subunit AcrA (membrane-fusion protein)
MKKWVLIASFALTLLFACTPIQEPPSPSQVQPQIEDTSISASARVIPETYATLSFVNGGNNIDLLVSPGDVVKTGQVLAIGDKNLLQIGVAQAEASLRQAQAALKQLENQPANEVVKAAEAALVSAEYNVDRAIDRGALRLELAAVVAARDSAQANLDTIKAGAVPEQLESARSAVALAQAAVDVANLSLSQTEIVAPFDGHIIEIYIRDYESASPGAPVVLLANLSKLKLETTDLSEIDGARLSSGLGVKISFDAFPGQDIGGTISKIALKSAPGSGVNYTLEIDSDAFPEGIRWGMSAFVVIEVP